MTPQSSPTNWLQAIDHLVPLLGHRNWLIVADAAYPMHCAPGIQTIHADGDPLDALGVVMHRLSAARHLQPIAHLDAEIDYVDDDDAPGASEYRRRLIEHLAGVETVREPHETILARLDQVGKEFTVLVVKSSARIPYTSVFFEFGCGYWSGDAEARLRGRMPPGG